MAPPSGGAILFAEIDKIPRRPATISCQDKTSVVPQTA